MQCDGLNRCLEHVVNLANVDIMSHITKIGAIENQTAIWEYDPDLPDNRVLGGSLDVIAAVGTISIKVCYDTHYYNLMFILWIRFRPLVSASNTLRSCRFSAR